MQIEIFLLHVTMILLTPVVLLQSKIRNRGMWPSQHEVSESLSTIKEANKVKGFWI